jgi:hypothetical protein
LYCRLDVIGGLLSLYKVLQWIGVIYMLVLITENGCRIDAAANPLRDPFKNLTIPLLNKLSFSLFEFMPLYPLSLFFSILIF